MKCDLKDWFIIMVITGAYTAGTVYLFMFHAVEIFVAWCGLCATMGGIYHWLNVRDSKQPDA
jgi:hypothetical protein